MPRTVCTLPASDRQMKKASTGRSRTAQGHDAFSERVRTRAEYPVTVRASSLLRLCAALEQAQADALAVANDPSELRYATAQVEARELELLRTLELHPVWPWLKRISYVPLPLWAQLLARLDTAAFHSASPLGFWSVCGIEADLKVHLECPACDMGLAMTHHRPFSPWHNRPGTNEPCPEPLLAPAWLLATPVRDADAVSFRERVFDAAARRSCTAIAKLLTVRHPEYRKFFRQRRAELRRLRPGWSEGRRYRTTMREAEQLLLEHLWTVWREATGLPLAERFAGVAQASSAFDYLSGALEPSFASD